MSVSTSLPAVDRRRTEIRHLDLPYTFTAPKIKSVWDKRARSLREHILVSLGLWPSPEKCPLNPQVFDRVERDNYTIEKVYFESLPGFFVTGNLYRPIDASAPCPGILNPHGHWAAGRLADEKDGSVPARCINFARQGAVAFAWSMIGYNDSEQLDHRSFGNNRMQLWGLSLKGLQLWNSIRAVDFMASLPDVDNRRIACTGASGGGTQTFMLTAVDDRVMLSAPVNMISGHMQGGCICENGPNVRINTNNIEIGAMMAPRPMLMVSCTGDWTVNTPVEEYPAIKNVYQLFEAEAKITEVQIDTGHNYNEQSRNAVYAWFGKWLFNSEDTERFTERPYTTEPPESMLVFTDQTRPEHAVDEGGLSDLWITRCKTQLGKLIPKDTKSLRKYRQNLGVGFKSAIGASAPGLDDVISAQPELFEEKNYTAQWTYIGRKDKGDRIPVTLYKSDKAVRGATLVVHPEGRSGLTDENGKSAGTLLQSLMRDRHTVLTVDTFLTGEASGEHNTEEYPYYTTYNRTKTTHRIQDIITAISYLRQVTGFSSVSLIGLGEAGLWCLLACGLDPHIVRVVVDTNQLDTEDDQAYEDSLFIPCLRRIGDVNTAVALTAPADLMLHNAGTTFKTDWMEEVCRIGDTSDHLKILKKPATGRQIVQWIIEGPEAY